MADAFLKDLSGIVRAHPDLQVRATLIAFGRTFSGTLMPASSYGELLAASVDSLGASRYARTIEERREIETAIRGLSERATEDTETDSSTYLYLRDVKVDGRHVKAVRIPVDEVKMYWVDSDAVTGE